MALLPETRGRRPLRLKIADMASTKRIPKRSIIGARVTVKCVDGFWRPGVVAAMRSSPALDLPTGEKKFSVRLERLGTVMECREAEIVGPGFLSNLPISTRLLPGQVSRTTRMFYFRSFFFLAQSDARTIICHKQSFQRLKKSFESSSKYKLVIECFLGHLQPQIVVFVEEDYIQRFPPEIGEEGCSVHHNWLKYGFG